MGSRLSRLHHDPFTRVVTLQNLHIRTHSHIQEPVRSKDPHMSLVLTCEGTENAIRLLVLLSRLTSCRCSIERRTSILIYCAAYESCNPLIIMSLTAKVPKSTDALLCAPIPTCRPVSRLHGLSDVNDTVTCDLLIVFSLSEERCTRQSREKSVGKRRRALEKRFVWG